MYRDRASGPRDWQPRKTFLTNHTVCECAFVQLCDIWFRPSVAFFIDGVDAKDVAHVRVTRAPAEQWTAEQWTAQQLREATSFGQGTWSPAHGVAVSGTRPFMLLDSPAARRTPRGANTPREASRESGHRK